MLWFPKVKVQIGNSIGKVQIGIMYNEYTLSEFQMSGALNNFDPYTHLHSPFYLAHVVP